VTVDTTRSQSGLHQFRLIVDPLSEVVAGHGVNTRRLCHRLLAKREVVSQHHTVGKL